MAGTQTSSWQRGGAALGVVTAFTAITAALLTSPTFTWTGSSLSDLGAVDAATAPVFNTGLILAVLLTLPYALARLRDDWSATLPGDLCFLITVLLLGMIGGFPVGTALHTPVSIAFFVMLTFTLLVHGTGQVLEGREHAGLGTIWLGILHILGWTVWRFLLRDSLGLAAPETAGALIIGAWTLYQVQVWQLLPRKTAWKRPTAT